MTPLGEGEERIALTMEYVTNPDMGTFKRLYSNLKDSIAYFGLRTVFKQAITEFQPTLLGVCPTLTVLLRRMICDPSASFSARKNPQRIPANTPPVSGPAASHLAAPPSPRHEGNVGQAPSRTLKKRSSLTRPWQPPFTPP